MFPRFPLQWKLTTSLPLSLSLPSSSFSLAVQENVESGVDAPIRDESVWEPGFRIHLQHLPR